MQSHYVNEPINETHFISSLRRTRCIFKLKGRWTCLFSVANQLLAAVTLRAASRLASLSIPPEQEDLNFKNWLAVPFAKVRHPSVSIFASWRHSRRLQTRTGAGFFAFLLFPSPPSDLVLRHSFFHFKRSTTTPSSNDEVPDFQASSRFLSPSSTYLD